MITSAPKEAKSSTDWVSVQDAIAFSVHSPHSKYAIGLVYCCFAESPLR
ncbi:MAG TPA: hypothetical protein V6C91_10550 [Coleofasciculaceae cyanobacterium]